MATKRDSSKKPIKRSAPGKGSPSLEAETESNVRKVAHLEETQKHNRTAGEKIAEVVANFCGSMIFVYVHIVWFGTWIIVNSAIPSVQFDPFPYTFLTLVVSLEAIFLSTFILISQNHETQLTDRRNNLDLQINLLAEQENTKMLELLKLIAEKIGVSCEDSDTEALLEAMEPGTLIEQILSAAGQDPAEVKSKK